MAKETFDLEAYLSNGVEKIVNTILRFTLRNPKESLFMMQYAAAARKAAKRRKEFEEQGVHIPPFLIASITNRCNLHCKGCYARANHSCYDQSPGKKENPLMQDKEWETIFAEAQKLGIGFILLAGGEPFVRKDVLLAAGEYKNILFPIFTNGTMIDHEYLSLLEQKRNLVPILSIEGEKETTNARRGEGVYETLQETMQALHRKDVLYGASVTVTKENGEEVLSEKFIEGLAESGCKAVIYVEYVPIDAGTKALALGDEEREYMAERIRKLREKFLKMLFVSFPGDEKSSGGCLAAGRGFFHINAFGQAEPCPFSPYSDTNLKNLSLLEALKSPLFLRLQEQGNLQKEHIGGCVLFEQQEEVKAMLGGRA